MARCPIGIDAVELLQTIATYPSIKQADIGRHVSVYTDSARTVLATIYAAETGGTTLSQPLTADQAGAVPGWVQAQGRYYYTAGALQGAFDAVAALALPRSVTDAAFSAITVIPEVGVKFSDVPENVVKVPVPDWERTAVLNICARSSDSFSSRR